MTAIIAGVISEPFSDLVLIHGDERHLVDRDVARWKRAAAAAGCEVEIVDAPTKLDPLRRSLLDVPFIDPFRYVLVRDPPQLSATARRGAEGADALTDALRDRNPTTRVCIVSHQQVSERNPVLTAMAEWGGQLILHHRLRGRDLRAWLEKTARERGLRLSARALDYLIAGVGPDLASLDSELSKLIAFAPNGSITDHALTALVAADSQTEVWDVLERLLGPRPGAGAVALDDLLDEGRAPQYVLATLSGQIRDVVHAQALLGAGGGVSQIATTMRIPAWRAERLTRQARAVSSVTAQRWLRTLQRMDAASKAGEVSDSQALRGFALRAAADVAQRRSGQSSTS